jgi:hypothetical protein
VYFLECTVVQCKDALSIYWNRHGHECPSPFFFSKFLFTNLFSIKFLYFFITSSLFPYFNLFVSIFMQSYVNIKLHVSTLNQDIVSDGCEMSIRGLLFQWASAIKNPTKRVGLVQSGPGLRPVFCVPSSCVLFAFVLCFVCLRPVSCVPTAPIQQLFSYIMARTS